MPSIKKKQTGATLPLTVSELSLHSKGTNYDVISVQEPIILTSFGNQTGSGRHRLGSEAPVASTAVPVPTVFDEKGLFLTFEKLTKSFSIHCKKSCLFKWPTSVTRMFALSSVVTSNNSG